nr:hypothetical protein GCM10020093_070760 [Planobispora longispora]
MRRAAGRLRGTGAAWRKDAAMPEIVAPGTAPGRRTGRLLDYTSGRRRDPYTTPGVARKYGAMGMIFGPGGSRVLE